MFYRNYKLGNKIRYEMGRWVNLDFIWTDFTYSKKTNVSFSKFKSFFIYSYINVYLRHDTLSIWILFAITFQNLLKCKILFQKTLRCILKTLQLFYVVFHNKFRDILVLESKMVASSFVTNNAKHWNNRHMWTRWQLKIPKMKYKYIYLIHLFIEIY